MVSCSRRRKSACRSPCKWTVGKGCSKKSRSRRSQRRPTKKWKPLKDAPMYFGPGAGAIIPTEYRLVQILLTPADNVSTIKTHHLKNYLKAHNATLDEVKEYYGIKRLEDILSNDSIDPRNYFFSF